MSIRVNQLANRVGINDDLLVSILQERGYAVYSASSTIDNNSAKAIEEEFSDPDARLRLEPKNEKGTQETNDTVISTPLSLEEVTDRMNSSTAKERKFTPAEMACKTTSARVRQARKERKERLQKAENAKGELKVETPGVGVIEMPYLYFDGEDAFQLAGRFLVAPDFAATISNSIVARSAISVHPMTWSRLVPDRKFFEIWGDEDGPGGHYIADLESLNGLLSEPLFSKFELLDQDLSKIPHITWAREEPAPWKWVLHHYDELKEIFLNTPFFHLRLGTVKTDKAFIDADLSFIWPDTSLAHDTDFAEFTFQNEKGLLGSMGYHVGEDAAPESERRAILAQVFQAHQLNFPKELPDRYKNGWGLAGSAQRLRKIVDSISFFSKAYIGKHGDEHAAVEHWRSDLAWLKREFYDGKFSFSWPHLENKTYEQLVYWAKAYKKAKPERHAWLMKHLEGEELQEALINDLIKFVEEDRANR